MTFRPVDEVNIGDLILVFEEHEVIVNDITIDSRGSYVLGFEPVPLKVMGVVTWPDFITRTPGQGVEIIRE